MADEFRVFAYDICTNTLICELPAGGLAFDSRLNDAGQIGFTLALEGARVAAAVQPFLQYDGIPVALYVDRDGVIVWAGWAKTGNYQHSAHMLPVGGKEWLDYFSQRLICAPYDQVTYPNGLDPALLLSKAIVDCQDPAKGGAGANVGISVVGGSSSLPWIVPSYSTTSSFVSNVIADMTAGINPGTGGLDVWMDAHWTDAVGGTPAVTLHIVSPRAGRVAGSTGLMFDLLSAIDFTWPTDVGPACTTLLSTGGGSGQVAPRAVQQAPGVPVGSLGQSPRLDKVTQHSNILDPVLLNRLAYGEADEFGGTVAVPTLTIPTADPSTPLGTWIMGDDARLFAEPYERHPNGLDEYWRIVQHSVTVPDEGDPHVVITFNTPPVY